MIMLSFWEPGTEKALFIIHRFIYLKAICFSSFKVLNSTFSSSRTHNLICTNHDDIVRIRVRVIFEICQTKSIVIGALVLTSILLE